jgi:hypothetical protein
MKKARVWLPPFGGGGWLTATPSALWFHFILFFIPKMAQWGEFGPSGHVTNFPYK